MSKGNINVQKIRIIEDDPFSRAVKYYSILSILNNLELTEMDINLLSFIAVRGTISSGGAKKIFTERFNSSISSIGNYISKLSKRGFQVKNQANKIIVHPGMVLNFNYPIILQITIDGQEK